MNYDYPTSSFGIYESSRYKFSLVVPFLRILVFVCLHIKKIHIINFGKNMKQNAKLLLWTRVSIYSKENISYLTQKYGTLTWYGNNILTDRQKTGPDQLQVGRGRLLKLKPGSHCLRNTLTLYRWYTKVKPCQKYNYYDWWLTFWKSLTFIIIFNIAFYEKAPQKMP